MEITCDIAMDLVELYTSGVASDDSKEAVKNHLKSCKECRRFYEGYKKSVKEPERCIKFEASPDAADEILSKSVSKISKRLRRRRIAKSITNGVMLMLGAAALVKVIADIIDRKRS